MKKYKNAIFYVGFTAFFLLMMFFIVQEADNLETGRKIVVANSEESAWTAFIESMLHNFQHPLAILLAQIATIMFAARIFGWLFRKIGQPTVIGEIVAGIVLGPSLIGMYFPEFSEVLFPIKSLGNIQFLSQIGLILFMFVVGMELDLKVLRNKADDAVIISHASIVMPFALGMGLAYFIYQEFAPVGVQFLSFGLFLGIAMSITAFPVLARIVQERGIHKTRLGTIVITCAAADDITAWCLLAAVIAIVKAGSFLSSLYVIFLAVLYVIFVIKVVRPFLKRIGDLHTSREHLSKPIVAIFFITLIFSAYATEVIGIHALFGAFMAGAIMPENVKFRNIFIEKVEDVSLVLLLPLFFVFTGLRTQIGLLNDLYLWQVTGFIILVAVIGKFVGSAIAAKYVGQTWKDSLTIGALMNTRGLMELVVLNIGYDLGVLTPEIFAMMVIMALVTTFMTGPALDIINKVFGQTEEPLISDSISDNQYKILISFGHPERGRTLLRLANSLVKKMNENALVTAMHLTPATELNHLNEKEYEVESFSPIVNESQVLNQKITTLFKASNEIEYDIADTANKIDCDILLIGVGQSIFVGSLLGKFIGFTSNVISPDKIFSKVIRKDKLIETSPFDDRTKAILSKSDVPVGILIDKGLAKVESVFVPIFSKEDIFLMPFVQKLILNNAAQVEIWDALGILQKESEIRENINAIAQISPNLISIKSGQNFDLELVSKNDLCLFSLESWKKFIDVHGQIVKELPSALIIKP